jgi:hypothetical protein
MARIRSIKPETFTSDDVNGLSVKARWSFVGLWCYVDDAGRGRADPRLVKAAVWPIDDSVSPEEVAGHLDEMERRSMICRYESGGLAYLHVVEFGTHQRINRPTPSKLPDCSRQTHGALTEDAVTSINSSSPEHQVNGLPAGQDLFTEDSLSDDGTLTEGSLRARKEQGTGNREQGTKPARRAERVECGSDQDPDFTAFWDAYPRKVGKGQARDQWRAAIKRKADPKEIILAAERFRDDPARKAKPIDKTCHPGTWLHGERYNDAPESGASQNGTPAHDPWEQAWRN